MANTANSPKAKPILMVILPKIDAKKKIRELNIKYVNTKSLLL
jgi:hypothetical protein